MGKADRISGGFWLIFAVIVSIESYRLGLGTLIHPGPGFFYFCAGVFLGIMSLVILRRGWRSKRSGEPESPIFGEQNWTKIVFVLVSIFLYALLMEKLGFILVTFLLFIFLLGVIEKRGWRYASFFSVAITTMAYLIFETWLKCQLPKGFIRF